MYLDLLHYNVVSGDDTRATAEDKHLARWRLQNMTTMMERTNAQ